jgi:hypothetical protein
MTHDGGAPRWEIVRDESAPSPPYVFVQLSQDRTAGRFPLVIWERASIVDGSVTVAFKTVDGAVDQAAGIVWRYEDPNNYYIVRANALEENVVLYKVENGIRQSIVPKGLPSRSYGVKRHCPRAMEYAKNRVPGQFVYRVSEWRTAFRDGRPNVYESREDRPLDEGGQHDLLRRVHSGWQIGI